MLSLRLWVSRLYFLGDAGGKGDVFEDGVTSGAGTGKEIVLFWEVVADACEFVDESVLS